MPLLDRPCPSAGQRSASPSVTRYRGGQIHLEGCGRRVVEPQAPPGVDSLPCGQWTTPACTAAGQAAGGGRSLPRLPGPSDLPAPSPSSRIAVAMAFAARSAAASHVVLAGQGARPGPAIPRRGVAAAAVKRVVATGALGGPIEPAAESPTRGGAGRVRRGPSRPLLTRRPPTLCNASLGACHCMGFTFMLTYQAPLCVQTMPRR